MAHCVSRSRFAALPPPAARLLLALLGLAAVAGFAVGFVANTTPVPVVPPDDERSGADLKLYRQVVEEVRGGANYYDVLNRELRRWGYNIGSVFNWRLPTYAYVLSLLPGPVWIQALLLLLALCGLLLTFAAERNEGTFLRATSTVLLQFGVVVWGFAADVYYTQELWAAVLILVSVGAHGLRWHAVAVAAGLLALFFRELALPYCLAAGAVAWYAGRRREAGAWLVGVVLFGVFLAWHASQVARRLTPEDVAGSRGIAEWVRFGGLAFDLMTTRMNAFLLLAPGWVVFVYLFLSVLGLAGWMGERGTLLTAATGLYLAAFSVVGQDMNAYWGLLFTPFLPFGLVRGPAALRDLLHAARRTCPDRGATRQPSRETR